MDPSKCTNNIVSATEAQLVYWPSTAASQSKYFCAEPSPTGPFSPGDEGVNTTTVWSGSTLTYLHYTAPSQTPFYPTPTADGPNTVAIGSVTVTSPSVAIIWKGIGRWDGCGPTISTIAVYDPAQISTARGFGIGASYAIMPMNWADLNWRCPPAEGNGTYTTAVGPDGNKCYQDVAAHAYWLGKDQAGAWLTANRDTTPVNTATMTISPDYHVWISQEPFSIDVFQSYWGEGAAWLPNGMWDPPSAIQLGTAVASATMPAGVAATTTVSRAAESTPATPASATTSPLVSATAEPVTVQEPTSKTVNQAPPTASQQTTNIIVTLQPQKNTPLTSTTFQEQPSKISDATTILEQSNGGVGISSGQAHVSGQNTVQPGSILSDGSSQNSVSSGSIPADIGSAATAEATTTPSVPTTVVGSASQMVTIGSSVLSASVSGAVVVVGSQILSVGGSATAIAGQVVSAASDGIVIGTGSTAATISIKTTAPQPPAAVAQTGVVTIGNSAVTIVSSTGSAVVVGTATLSAGGPATFVAGQTVSAISTGLIIGTGPSAQTIGLTTGAPVLTGVVVSLQETTFTASQVGSNIAVGSATLTPGGTATSIDGQLVSAASSGVIIVGTGSTARTVSLSGLDTASNTRSSPPASSANSSSSTGSVASKTTISTSATSTSVPTVSYTASSTTATGAAPPSPLLATFWAYLGSLAFTAFAMCLF